MGFARARARPLGEVANPHLIALLQLLIPLPQRLPVTLHGGLPDSHLALALLFRLLTNVDALLSRLHHLLREKAFALNWELMGLSISFVTRYLLIP